MRIRRTIGLDIHRDRIYVTELRIWDYSVKQYEISTREKDLEAFLATLDEKDQVALEATRGSRYYVSRLAPIVAAVSVANPAKVQFFSKNAKNDRNDSFCLALLLSLGVLPTVWTPGTEIQQDRDLLSYRCSLVQDQIRIKNRVRAQMAEHGIAWDGSDIKSACAQRFILKLKHRLPWTAQEVLTQRLEQLEQIEQRLRQLEPVLEARAARWPEVALLMTIRGINVLTAFTIMAVIGRIDRFATPDSLANYAGLVPRQRSSAGKSRNGAITKAGSKKLRWALTEAVQSLCKVDGPYRNLCKRLERKNKGKGVAATACARKLLTAIWCMLTRGEAFHHADPTLCEDKARRRERRLKAARAFVEEQKKRHDQVIKGQLALIQELSSRRVLMPIPPQLEATFGRRLAATG